MNNAINFIFLIILTVLTSVAAAVVFEGIAVPSDFNVPFVILMTLFTTGFAVHTFIEILSTNLTK